LIILFFITNVFFKTFINNSPLNHQKRGKMKKLTIKEIEDRAKEIRKDVIHMVYGAQSGHIGGAFSSAEIISSLFFNALNHDPKKPDWNERDRFVLSKGHACAALYSAMARSGYFPISELNTFRKINSRLQGHPSRADLPMLEASTGSLGQGLSIAVGIALGVRLDNLKSRVYCLVGDGELEEGQIWEAAMAASHYQLDNLCAIIDVNGLQIDGWTKDVMNSSPLLDKFEAFGWHVIEVDGHNVKHILRAFEDAKKIEDMPVAILAQTVKGKGVTFMENQAEWHGKAPTKEEMVRALVELGDGKDER
jgi:transketolase